MRVSDFLTKTPGRDTARKSGGPTDAAFNASKWATLVQSHQLERDDLELLASGLCIAAEAQTLRQSAAAIDHANLGARLSTQIAMASLNRIMRIAQKAHADLVEDSSSADTIPDLGLLGAMPLPQHPGIPSIDDFNEAVCDAIESWLYDAEKAPRIEHKVLPYPNEDVDEIVSEGLRHYAHQRGLHRLWQQTAWEGWRMAADADGATIWNPIDKDLAKLLDAWLVRHRESAMNFPHIDAVAWGTLTDEDRRALHLVKSAVAIKLRRGSKKRDIAVGRPSVSGSLPSYLVAKGSLEGSYLGKFLDLPFPANPSLNCALLLKAWYVIKDVADLLDEGGDQDLTSMRSIKRNSLTIDIGSVQKVLRSTLGCTISVAEAATNFLTWKPKTYKGIWGTPLVPVPGTDSVCLARPVLGGSNLVRCAEIWLEKGGLGDDNEEDTRGLLFESQVRRDLADALAQNELIRDARVATAAIQPTAGFNEEIDLLFQIGSLLVVGEVKCHLFPADPIERFRHIRKLAAAAEQASRKAKAIGENRAIAAQALGISLAKAHSLIVVPLVVGNHGFGVSLDINGCVVTDASILRLYLGGGSYVEGALIRPQDGLLVEIEEQFYTSEGEAVLRFEATMRRPPMLRRFVDRLKWTRALLWSGPSGATFIAKTTFAAMDDVRRQKVEALAKQLSISKPAA